MESPEKATEAVNDKSPKDLMLEKLLSLDELDLKQPASANGVQIISPRSIIGPAHPLNKGALDWGRHGLLAYGSNFSVAIVDTKNCQHVQCLDRHKAVVNGVLWVPVKTKPDNSPCLEVVSSDTMGHIIYWDVVTASPLAVLQDGNKPVLGLKWSPGGGAGDLILAALYSPYYLVLWDLKKQSKLWKKGFTDTLISFHFNPFDSSKLAFLCVDCILFVDDFIVGRSPSSNGRKFYISSPSSGGESPAEEIVRARDQLKRLMKGLVVGETKPRPDDAMTISECLQLCYHRSLRHHMLLLYPRDILLIDLHINQTIGIIPTEKTVSPLVQLLATRQRDILYCLHESGSVSVKVRRRQSPAVLPSPLDAPADSVNSYDAGGYHSGDMFICYEHKCQSEVIRQMKGTKVLGMTCSPMCERKIALLLSSGKVVLLDLEPSTGLGSNCEVAVPLARLIPPSTAESSPAGGLRLLVSGLLSGAAYPVTGVRMCPTLTSRNRLMYTPLLATGYQSGLVQVYNVACGLLHKELAVHSYPVRGIEWTDLQSFLSFAHSSGTVNVRNELFLTDVSTGQSRPLRTNRGEENPIDIVKVSPLGQYFVVILKDGPFELWDRKNLLFLRTMPKKFPSVTALEWSPIHSVKSFHAKKKLSVDGTQQAHTPTTPIGHPGLAEGSPQLLNAKEHLVFSDTESQLYHFSVEGDSLRDGIKIPPEAGVSMVTSIAFKNNQIAQGDVDGMLNIWDLKARSSRNMQMGRGWVKKMRFAPGKGNLKLLVLYADGVDIVDLKHHQFERISQLKCPKDMVKVIDVDWAAPDMPVLATEDGCIRITDITLSTSASPIKNYTFEDVVCCPALLTPSLLSQLQLLLSTQFWKSSPHFSQLSVEDGLTQEQVEEVNGQLEMLGVNEEVFTGLGTAERCLLASLLLGDQQGVDFWTVTAYYLQVAAIEAKHSTVENTSMNPFESFSASDLKRINRYPSLLPLDTCYDILCDPYSYQRMQLERVNKHEWKRGDYKHTQRVIERLILLGEMDRAVQLLLETDLDNPNYYTDGIKACLVATIQQTGAAQSTIKLVATNLIANGKIWEGVQLLCLIGKGLDGCRYLISYGLWESAVWLAKSILPAAETVEVMKKWADHLNNTSDQNGAVLVLLSMGQIKKALELLHSQGNDIQAALLLIACSEFQQLSNTIQHKSLVTSICKNFSQYLESIGITKAENQIANKLSFTLR